MLVTYRHETHGGKGNCDESTRFGVLKETMKFGNVKYVDIEYQFAEKFLKGIEGVDRGGTEVIVSYHEFERTIDGEGLMQVYQRILKLQGIGVDVIKIAIPGKGPSALCDLLRVLQGSVMKMIGIVMGDGGIASRVLCAKFGGLLTFATVESSGMRGSAPGQLSVEELLGKYRFRSISNETAFYGIIGKPVQHSMSPTLHNLAFQRLSENAVYVPFLLTASTENTGLFIRKLLQIGCKGLSITIPCKMDAMEVMDYLSPSSRQIDAINTVTTNNIYIAGFNTDWSAAISAILKTVKPEMKEEDIVDRETDVVKGQAKDVSKGKKMVCLGAGGTARAVLYGPLQMGVESVVIVNRTLEKAKELEYMVDDKRVSVMSLDEFKEKGAGEIDILANTTSVGMSPNVGVSPIPESLLKPEMIVFDAVYNPMETELLRLAKKAGCKTVSGLDMFVGQAVRQLQHWFPLKHDLIPTEEMKNLVIENLQKPVKEVAEAKR